MRSTSYRADAPDSTPAPPSAPASSVRLDGEVVRITFFNPENGYTVAALRPTGARTTGERDVVRIVGNLPNVQPGEVLHLDGRWTTHASYGRQFAVERCETSAPGTAEAMSSYLGSGAVPGVGRVLAERLVGYFGEGVLDVLDRQPHRVAEVPGIGRKRAGWLAESWNEHRALRGIIGFLYDNGVSTVHAHRILRAMGPTAPETLRANPYRLVQEVPSVGFAVADAIARRNGTPAGAPARLQAGVVATLQRAAGDGHCYLPLGDLVMAADRTLGNSGDDREAGKVDLGNAVRQHLLAGRLVAPALAPPTMRVPADGVAAPPSPADARPPQGATVGVPADPAPAPRSTADASAPPRSGRTVRVFAAPADVVPLDPATPIYLPAYRRAELSLAGRLRGALARKFAVDEARARDWLARWCARQRIELAPEQAVAVLDGASRGLFVLTGGPGSGKTTTLRALVGLLRAMGRSVALAAPTGKAAKRMAEVIGVEASTLHRLLGAQPAEGFAHDEANPLPVDALVVDEASMLDLFLADATLRAVGPRTQLLLVGDGDQLPSVGAGQVLRDLLGADGVPAVRLTRIFRQAEGSDIVLNAAGIRAGEAPVLTSPGGTGPLPSDCVFVAASGARAIERAAAWVVDELPRRLELGTGDIQVLAPLTRNVGELNRRLQARLNPPGAGKPERPRGALPLRLGDRVIQTANDYRLEVFNGETGPIVAIDESGVTVDFGDRQVSYGQGDLYQLDHAYALTVHRSQGSEWPAVVIVLTAADGPLLSRPLLYTALTRAKRCAVLVGEADAIARAAAEVVSTARYSGLRGLLDGASDDLAWSAG